MRGTWRYETCKCCTREQRIAWTVSNVLWERVVILYYSEKVLCLECFLRMADDREVKVSFSEVQFEAFITR